MNNFFDKVLDTFFLTKIEHKLYKYFNLKKKKEKPDIAPIVIVQCVEDYFYYSLFAQICTDLNAKLPIHVEQYVLRNLYIGSTRSLIQFVKSFLFGNRFRDNKWIKLYSSFCDGVAYRHEGSTNIFFDILAFYRAYNFFKKINSKAELLSLHIDDLYVGDLIYDSYLRFKPAPTVDINDIYLLGVIWQTLRTIKVADEYFKTKKPKILLTSYSTYIQHGVAVRIALKYGTSVFSFGNNQSLYKELSLNDFYHTAFFKNYKSDFEKLDNKEDRLKTAKLALESRLNGIKDVATSYMKVSAYEITNNIQIPKVKDSIVIFLHDFFDSPHVYGNMLFHDFLEWVEFTIKVTTAYNIPFYLKPHPNQISDSVNVIETLKQKYPHLPLLSSQITNRQLVEAGIKVGVSVYGTVAHELTYMGVPVILCGENPHSSYNFCFEAKTIDEYKEYLISYKSLKVELNSKYDIESFYYMHNLLISVEMQQLMSMIVFLRRYNYKENERYLELFESISENLAFKKYIDKLTKECSKCY